MLSGQNSSNQNPSSPTGSETNLEFPKQLEAPQSSEKDSIELITPLPDSKLYRLIERFVALTALILISPAMLLIAIALRLQGEGPAFYSQTRVGLGEKLFTIYKFRTMHTDAEAKGPFICTNYVDSRITRLGKLLRKSKLDELPQLWNVFRGDMSFVGPRPERPHFHAQFSAIPHWRERTRVYPGLTGLAQASKWISHDPEEKLEADRVYLAKRSILLDMRLVIYTIYPKSRPKTYYGIRLN